MRRKIDPQRTIWPLKISGNEEEPEDEEVEKEEVPGKESVIFLDLLKKKRTIIISEPILPKLTQRVIAQLLWLDSEQEAPIRLYLNTPGGSADDGFALFDIIRFVKSPVTTICVGLSASAGVLTLLGAPKERRLSLPNARFMMHQPSGGGRGRASDIEITAEEILKLRQRANDIISAETGRPLEQVDRDTDRDYWMNADEAKSYGLISGIISSLRDII